jgi:hypothetical protein
MDGPDGRSFLYSVDKVSACRQTGVTRSADWIDGWIEAGAGFQEVETPKTATL